MPLVKFHKKTPNIPFVLSQTHTQTLCHHFRKKHTPNMIILLNYISPVNNRLCIYFRQHIIIIIIQPPTTRQLTAFCHVRWASLFLCVLTCGRQATKAPPNFLVPQQTHTPSSGLMYNNWNNNVIIFPTRLTTRRKENFPDRYSHYPYLLSLALHSAPTHPLRCHSAVAVAVVVVVVVSCAAHHARRFALNIRWTKTLYRFT